VLAQQNEITAIPDLLAMLELQGALVSIDAIGCQKDLARQIVEAGADYVLALKDNPPTLHEDVRLYLDTELGQGRLPVLETVEKEHGRIETRRYGLSTEIDWLEQKPQWVGLVAVGRVESSREVGDKTSTACRYSLCSVTEVARFAEAVRGHWSIENQQHWVLDVQFGEDANRARKDHSAENLALIRRMALNLLRRDSQAKDSLRRRKLRAMLSDNYRSYLLFGNIGT
jgi:predicted transposase YbfD/YdcC